MSVRYAARNLQRHRGRTLLTLAAIALGVAALTVAGGFVHDIYAQLAEAVIHSQSGHLQVGKAGIFGAGSRSPEKHLIDDGGAIEAAAAAIPGVKASMSRVGASGLLSTGRREAPVMLEGVEPAEEAPLSTGLTFLTGRNLNGADRMAVIVGEGVADLLALRPGSAVTVLAPTIDGAMNTLELDVVGVFRSFSKEYDARTIKVPIAAAKDLLATPSVMKIVVLLDRTSDTSAIAARLAGVAAQRGLVVKDWVQLNDFYQGTVELYDRQFGVLNLIILVMVVLGVSNSVNMSVLERLGEFGTLQAIGLRKSDIVRLIMAENVLLGFVGAAAGAVVGIGVALAISAYGIPMPPPPNSNAGYTATIRIVPAVVATAVAVGFIATLIAGMMPAWRVARTPIVEALRENV